MEASPSAAGQEKNFSAHPELTENTEVLPSTADNGSYGNPSVNANPYFETPLQSAFARSSDTVSDLSISSADNENERSTGRLLTPSAVHRLPSRFPVSSPTTWRGSLDVFWLKNKGLALVMLAQLFAVMMNVTTRLLEMDGSHGTGMHPFQILFARMTGTLVLSFSYQYLVKVKHAPFGPREMRKLLIARGMGGFFGVYGMYYSLKYLPISDATVITFLAPIVACCACSILMHEPFTRTEQIAGIISFLGVILIARPTSLLLSSSSSLPAGSGALDGLPTTSPNATYTSTDLQCPNNATAAQRLSAVGVALIGVLGAACAYTTIRWIGKRAHPLISVTYFAAGSTIVSTLALLLVPGIGFHLPAGLRQWTYLLFLGVCGFVMQLLLTAGLQHEKSSRATNMVYTQMLFALAFDKLVWGSVPGGLSIVGSSLILGSALYIAVLSKKKGEAKGRDERGDEEVGLAGDQEEDEGDETRDGPGPLRGLQKL